MEERPLEIIKDPADKANYDRRIRSIIFHYTVSSETKALETLKHTGVSVHFLVPRQQEDALALKVIEIVAMKDRARHAGISYWQAREGLNDTSVGIEIVNSGYGFVQKNGHILYHNEVNAKVKFQLENCLKNDGIYQSLEEKGLLLAFFTEMFYGRILPRDECYYNKEISRELREQYKKITANIKTNLPDPFLYVKNDELYAWEKEGKIIWEEFPQAQVQAVILLAQQIIQKTMIKDNDDTVCYKISPTAMTGHGDIAPGRKSDPGPKFPWQYLASQGIGAWPDENDVREVIARLSEYTAETQSLSIDFVWLQQNLHKYGYNIQETGIFDQQTRDVLISFQMHFRPQKYDGMPDVETRAILAALIKKYYPSQYEDPLIEENKKTMENISRKATV